MAMYEQIPPGELIHENRNIKDDFLQLIKKILTFHIIQNKSTWILFECCFSGFSTCICIGDFNTASDDALRWFLILLES